MGDDLGSRIRTRRESLGISLAGLAQAAGLSSDDVEQIEAGTTEPGPEILRNIASALATTAEDLQRQSPW